MKKNNPWVVVLRVYNLNRFLPSVKGVDQFFLSHRSSHAGFRLTIAIFDLFDDANLLMQQAASYLLRVIYQKLGESQERASHVPCLLLCKITSPRS